jgi:hypothetical protein
MWEYLFLRLLESDVASSSSTVTEDAEKPRPFGKEKEERKGLEDLTGTRVWHSIERVMHSSPGSL